MGEWVFPCTHSPAHQELRLSTLHLEGLFRSFQGGVERNDTAVLEAIQQCRDAHPLLEHALRVWEDRALFSIGQEKVRRGRGRGRGRGRDEEAAGDGQNDGGVDDGEIPLDTWYIHTASALARIGGQLQNELLQTRLMSFFIEWCSTDSPSCSSGFMGRL